MGAYKVSSIGLCADHPSFFATMSQFTMFHQLATYSFRLF